MTTETKTPEALAVLDRVIGELALLGRDEKAAELIKACAAFAAEHEALKQAREFIDRHSESWYSTGQTLLAEIDKALAAVEKLP